MDDQSAAYINHMAVVADESYSMKRHADALVSVADNITAHLADRSKFHDQETRLTFYTFSARGGERCLFYDKDVLRMPSVRGRYSPRTQTALIDAMLLAIGDLEKTAQLYGEHAFMLYLLSDGIENNSSHRPPELAARIASLPPNWTVAGFVPDQQALFELKRCGFPAGNIAVWDTTSAVGMEEVGSVIRDSAEVFMTGRAQGVQGYNRSPGGLFRLREFTAAEVKTAVPALAAGSYYFLDVAEREEIRDFVARQTGAPYDPGKAFYQFTKPELIQGTKQVAVELDGRVYAGSAARDVLGLPGASQRVSPDRKAGAVIFVQSTSYNRKLVPGTRVLMLR